MFTVVKDVLKGIGLLFQLLWEEAVTITEPIWRALKRFLLYGTLVPLFLFILGFILRSTILLTLGGIFLCVAFVLVTLAFTPLIALIGKYLKKDDQAGSRFVKTILSIWLWELLTVFYCVVFPVWNDYRSLMLVGLCALILSLASVVWGVGYITWFRKVLVVLVAFVFAFCTLSFFLPATATTLRKTLPNFDQYLNHLLSTKRAAGDLLVADVNRDDYLDSLDVKWLKKFVADPKLMPDSTRGDVNADGKIDSVDVRYLEDYLYNGGWPPKVPKPKPVLPVKPKVASLPPPIIQKIPDSQVSKNLVPRRKSIDVTSPNALQFFTLTAKEVEISDKDIRIRVCWVRTHSNPEAASVSFKSYLIDDNQNRLPIKEVEGITINSKVVLYMNTPFEAVLVFSLPSDGHIPRSFTLFLQDLWGNGPFVLLCFV